LVLASVIWRLHAIQQLEGPQTQAAGEPAPTHRPASAASGAEGG
jgi:hypothetical protein